MFHFNSFTTRRGGIRELDLEHRVDFLLPLPVFRLRKHIRHLFKPASEAALKGFLVKGCQLQVHVVSYLNL